MTEKDNEGLNSLILELKKSKKPMWLKVAYELARPRKKKTEMNLSRLDALIAEGATVVVPGKILGAGNVSKKFNVAAFGFSNTAKMLIDKAGGKMLSIEDLFRENPNGSGIVFLK